MKTFAQLGTLDSADLDTSIVLMQMPLLWTSCNMDLGNGPSIIWTW